jgi:hypothetical protein
MEDIKGKIKQAEIDVMVAESKFNYAVGSDIDVAAFEIMKAKDKLNKLYAEAKGM